MLTVAKPRLLMGVATGLALTVAAYRSLPSSLPLMPLAHCSKNKKDLKKPPLETVKENEEVVESDTKKARKKKSRELTNRHGLLARPEQCVYLDLAASARCQPSVSAQDRAHTLLLWIRLRKNADPREAACKAARIQQYVEELKAPASSAKDTILAGVGFGPELYQLLRGGAPQRFTNAKHGLISGKCVGGDILIHAKADDQELLRQLSRIVLRKLPEDSVLKHQETYAITRWPEPLKNMQKEGVNVVNVQYYKENKEFPPPLPDKNAAPWLLVVSDNGRAASEAKKKKHQPPMDPGTGGSYVMTQRWVHDENDRKSSSGGDINRVDWVEKAWEDCARPPGETRLVMTPTSMTLAEMVDPAFEKSVAEAYGKCLALQKAHPGRGIVCSPGVAIPKRQYRILRQSLPYTKGAESGLVFITYASTPRYNDLLLERLAGSAIGEGGPLLSSSQNVFRLSRNVASASWYFPGLQELRELDQPTLPVLQ